MSLPTVILAGGLGTRISAATGGHLPKVLLDVAGRPFLDRKLEELADQGVTEVILLLGHKGDMVRDHLAERPPHGVRVVCLDEGPVLLGTGGAIVKALDVLPDAFFVTYGDTLLDQPMAAVENAFWRSGRPALMTVVHNRDGGQPSNVTVAGPLVVAYSKGEPPGTHDYLDYGLLIFRRSVFEGRPIGQPIDLSTIVASLVSESLLTAMVVDAEFHDVGTPEALIETSSRYRVVSPPATMP
jgi:NDP-sugar pyrophosphorylase family protein